MKANAKSTQLRTVPTVPPESSDDCIANVAEDIYNVRATLKGADKIIEGYWGDCIDREEGEDFLAVLRILMLAMERLEEIGNAVLEHSDQLRIAARKIA